MKILSADYIISAVGPKQYPEGELPEIAFAGRSNVGKSSLINKLLNRKSLARTSARPGKTQYLNYYFINKDYYFVDLPGYGFAKVPKEVKATWGKMIERYLRERGNLKAVIQLVDIRHEPSNEDLAMYQWLKHYQVPAVVVATKADKISRGNHPKQLKIIRQKLQMTKEDTLLLFSAETGQGKDELWAIISTFLGLEAELENNIKGV